MTRSTSISASGTLSGVEWMPGKIVYTMDGVPWATETISNFSDVPMQLAVQTRGLAVRELNTLGSNAQTAPRQQRLTWTWTGSPSQQVNRLTAVHVRFVA